MNTHNERNILVCHPIMPDGQGGFQPCPSLLTEEEAIRYLRLDTVGHKHPERTLKHYRDRRLLRPTRLGKKLFYSVWELESFIKKVTEN